MKKVLTIAGSDSSGGAGIQADLKTFSALGVYGMSVITAVTAQNTQGVLAVQDMAPEIIAKQIEAIYTDIQVDAVKIGMVSQVETIEAIAEGLRQFAASQVVLDPVMISKSGYHLLQPQAKAALIGQLLPLASIVTPNLPEAEELTGQTIKTVEDMRAAAQLIYAMGPHHVLVKGGHLAGEPLDLLYDGQTFHSITGRRIETKNTHGTGCTLSAAIAAKLAKGHDVLTAVAEAKAYITTAIEHSFNIGKGVGPTHHFYTLYKMAGIEND